LVGVRTTGDVLSKANCKQSFLPKLDAPVVSDVLLNRKSAMFAWLLLQHPPVL
jgi:hypothetical protein